MSSPRWTVIVPVKQTTIAKTRLTGVSEPTRRALAMAFALDAVDAAVACSLVRRVLVVTNEPTAGQFAEIGADVVPDAPDAGLNSALDYAAQVARHREPDAPVAAMAGDLPCLRPSVLALALDSSGAPRWFVSDAGGGGTTLLAASRGAPLAPAFGAESGAAHRAGGAEELTVAGLERLRRDVDTNADLVDARRLGVGARTDAVLAELANIGLA